jgi:hypothetical protein
LRKKVNDLVPSLKRKYILELHIPFHTLVPMKEGSRGKRTKIREKRTKNEKKFFFLGKTNKYP